LAAKKIVPGNDALKLAGQVVDMIDDIDQESVNKDVVAENIRRDELDMDEIRKELATIKEGLKLLSEIVLKGCKDGKKDRVPESKE